MTKTYELPDDKMIMADVNEKLHMATVSVYALDYLVEAVNKTGHWIEKDGFDGDTYYDCSECGESWTTIEGEPWNNGMKYCPNCGARMIESEE